jgi:peptidyl-Asp metalloendopeptidase
MYKSKLLIVLFGMLLMFKTAVGGDLFTFTASEFSADEAVEMVALEDMSPAAVKADIVNIDIQALQGDETMTLSMPDGFQYEAIAEEMKKHGDGNISWRGKLISAGEEDGHAVITVVDGVTAGYITTANTTYVIQPRNTGESVLLEIDPTLYPEDEHVDAIDPKDEMDDNESLDMKVEEDSLFIAPEPDLLESPDTILLNKNFNFDSTIVAEKSADNIAADNSGNPQIDVMVVYTTLAKNGAGGTANIKALIQNAVDVANDAYANSFVTQRINLVHTAEVGYNEGAASHLSWLRTNANVGSLRNTHGADLVAMVTNTGQGWCGIAYVMRTVSNSFESHGFSVTARGCIGGLVFAHELGHNMGLEHDPANGTAPANASYPYAFGHYVSGNFRTVMSYSNQCTSSCPRKAHFSNPSVSYNGVPTGIANQRDSARALRNTDSVVAAFRNGTPAQPTLISPKGDITDNTPQYRWFAVPTATWYALYVKDGSGTVKINQWFTAAATNCPTGVGVCSLTPATVLAYGAGNWWVKAYNGKYGSWSHAKAFNILNLPQKPTLISPNGFTFDSTPTYKWNAVPTATWYQLWVNDKNGNRIKKWYTAAQVGCAGGAGTCSVTPTTALAAGASKFWVKAYNGKYGPWSNSMSFTVIQFWFPTTLKPKLPLQINPNLLQKK